MNRDGFIDILSVDRRFIALRCVDEDGDGTNRINLEALDVIAEVFGIEVGALFKE